MASPTQLHRTIAVGTPLGDDVLLMRGFTFTERLGRPFEMVLDMLSTKSNIDFSQIVGQNVTVRIHKPKDNEPRYFNGIVRQFSQVGASGRLTNYKAVVVPWLWLLTRTSDCRIFQDMAVPDIIKKVFKDHGFTDIDDKISGSHRKWEYCCQYRETDFNFVSRLMEQEGIYYYFTHENGKHKMVLADSKSAHEPFAGYEEIVYRPPTSEFRQKEVFTELSVSQEVQPGTYAHTDFDFKAPAKDLQAKSQVQRQHAAADFEIYDYPGEYDQTGDGQEYAKSRIEELQSGFEIVRASGDVRGVATGCKFALQDHPTPDFNRDYLIVETNIEASTDEYDSVAPGTVRKGVSFQSGIVAIDYNTQFRAERRTPLPLIRGPQTAIVVGPSGEEIHTDKYGRVKVQFHWDRYSKADESSSCWIRVSQAVAGKKWGHIFLPRIGQEVIVEFFEGDPDRPIITGRVYNDKNMPPYDLPNNKTMSTLKSNSSKGGAGFNEIRFEDKKGEEQVFIHGEKNQDIRIKNDCFEWIGNNRHLIVKKDQFEHVENNRHEVVDADHMEEIGKDRHLKVVGKEAKDVGGSLSLKVGGDVIEQFGANHSEQVTSNYYVKAMQVVIEGMTQLTIKVGGSFVSLDPSGVTIQGPMVKINSGGAAGSGSPGSLVPPAEPTAAEEADNADPGKVEETKARQRQTQTGKYGSAQVKLFKKSQDDDEKKKHWIEIELVDEEDQPVPGEQYRITLPDGETVAEGTTDDKGLARVDGIDAGNCKITFPKLDKDAWEKAETRSTSKAGEHEDMPSGEKPRSSRQEAPAAREEQGEDLRGYGTQQERESRSRAPQATDDDEEDTDAHTPSDSDTQQPGV